MIRSWESRVLRWLRVPPEPQPPAGSPGSLRVFRAGRNYLRLRLIVWTGAQAGAIVGVMLTLVFIRELEIQVELRRLHADREAAAAAAGAGAGEAATTPEPEIEIERGRFHQFVYQVAPRWLRDLPSHIPARAVFWIKLGEALGLVGFVAQLLGSFVVVFLDYRQRWYMVTDRSLRLRWGVMNIQESTMSFANLQQVALHQGPLERLLGLWDVEVESAGGGSGKDHEEDEDSMHRCVFRAVEDGAVIRDIILARLRQYREAGLGDPDDVHGTPAASPGSGPATGTDAVQAAREVLAEVRALREALRAEAGRTRTSFNPPASRPPVG